MTTPGATRRIGRTKHGDDVVVRIGSNTATIAAKKRHFLEVMLESITATRRVPHVTGNGVEIVTESVCISSEHNEQEIATTLVPRVAMAVLEAGATVEVRRGESIRRFEPDGIRRRGLAAAKWQHDVLRWCGRRRCGQFVVVDENRAFQFAVQWLHDASDLDWLFIVANQDLVAHADALFGRELGPYPRTGAAIWQQRPHQAIVGAAEAPLEFAHVDFQQIIAVDARCLLTASTREFSELVRCQTLLFRCRAEKHSAAEELLLERLAGPVIFQERPTTSDQTIVVQCRCNQESDNSLQPCESLAALLTFVADVTVTIHPLITELFPGDVVLSTLATVVVGTESLAERCRCHCAAKRFESAQLTLQFLSLDNIVLEGIPSGIVIFWTGTQNWLQKHGPFQLRGDGIRVIIDPFATQNSRYASLDLTTLDWMK